MGIQAMESPHRPYWHVDLKWIFGILTSLFLSISLILYLLSALTAEKTAIPLATFVVASQFSRNGLDDPKDIEEAKKILLNSEQDVFYPLGDTNIGITRTDLQTLTPREIRLKTFRQVVEPFYFGQVDEKTKKQAGVLVFINKKLHQTLSDMFLISIIPSILSFSGLIYFSYRYGRLISPAVILLLLSSLPTVLFFLLRISKPPPDVQQTNHFLPFLPYEMAPELIEVLAAPYYFLFFSGTMLIGIALVIKLFPFLRGFVDKHK